MSKGLVRASLASAWVGLMGAFAAPASAAFVAFNDHIPGPGTNPNTTFYGMQPGGVPNGFLKDVNTGLDTPVVLTVSTAGAFSNNNFSPMPGTDAYNLFNGFVDFSASTGTSIEVAGGQEHTLTFSGLAPTATYDFAGTAVRGGNTVVGGTKTDPYQNRWTKVALLGADSFTNAHSVGQGVIVGDGLNGLLPNEVALWTGDNSDLAQGFVARWKDIKPGDDGLVFVVSSQYTGTTPFGTANGSKGYGLTGIRLEEIGGAVPEPSVIGMLSVASIIALRRRRAEP